MFEEQDALAVEAVRNGDRERYRELIERYERKVFAVAWSRLGNADLAADATQEAFIKGYRHLAFLNQGSKFAPWIMAIARNVSINLGLLRRNELKKHALWALEQVEPVTEATGDEPVSAETLRATLAELPAQHRECLVLFYLEGKSVAEAAAAFGLSETAFKTRLHRARGILRGRLEDKLETSLKTLRPRQALAPAIMVFLAAHPAEAGMVAGGAGVLGKIASGIASALPFPFFMAGIWLAGFMPGLLLARRLVRLQQANYREPEGFRARLHRAASKRMWIIVPVMILGFMLAGWTSSRWGDKAYFRIMGVAFSVLLVVQIRLQMIHRGRCIIYGLAAQALLIAGLLGVGFFGFSMSFFYICWAGFFLATALANRELPLRMDYNLFLRAAQGMVPEVPAPAARQFTRSEVFAFARFLGRHWLAVDYRNSNGGIRFRLSPVRVNPLCVFFPFVWRNWSTLAIAYDGGVQATLGRKDQESIVRLIGTIVLRREELEGKVARAVRTAFDSFLAGNIQEAKRSLGEQPEEAIFHEDPRRSKAACLRWRWMLVSAVIVAAAGVAKWMGDRSRSREAPPAHRLHLSPVDVTEADVRNTLAHVTTYDQLDPQIFNREDGTMHIPLVLPPRNMFTTRVWRIINDQLWQQTLPGRDLASFDSKLRVWALFVDDRLKKAFLSGLIPESDLADVGVTTSTVRNFLGRFSPRDLVILHESIEKELNVTNLVLNPLLLQLQVVQRFNCLDLVDAKPVIDKLRARQLSGRVPERGLFRCNFWGRELRDTCEVLAILSVVGGLDQIDRSACVDGILRFHRGKGFFGPSDEEVNGFLGDARDTFCAYESLRILGALLRVKDLDRWTFRPITTSPPAVAGAERTITWAEIEAWLYQNRLNRYLEARRPNPNITPPSLLTPVE